ncbi:MAG TPA: helix-turn-helix domain-containing protein [Pyrinomonadaceae bacterium]|nr:helix-turn-helix domain-containing protein [Pyrinomonadaceae bacterium]
MGRGSREKPERLGEKLAQIRNSLELSQEGMVKFLTPRGKLTRNDISKYERNVREPSLLMLLRYARVAGVSVDELLDDELDLPAKIGPSRSRKRR